MEGLHQCTSIKSRKYSELRCPNPATRGDFCAKHCKSKVVWVSNVPKPRPFTRRQKTAAETIYRFWIAHCRRKSRRIHGPALFVPSISDNEKDIYTFDTVQSIPFQYHFSYSDSSKHIWTFDIRFLVHLLQHGNDLKNPFSQELIDKKNIERFQSICESLRSRKLPILYVDTEILSPEQIWNQKVLDVFLKLNSLGYGANILWFENMTVYGHELFYRNLYDLWHQALNLTDADRDRIVPGHRSGRNPLFRWAPTVLKVQPPHEIKWWRKQTLGLMNAFLTRSADRETQTCGALYILTGLAHTLVQVAEVYPWLAPAGV